ncbi:MAG: hypothetical protein JWP69_1675 [Flaviaesturariibacter sp.]|nr:hypothetical protein [Flaviaesturariibacter sp.]
MASLKFAFLLLFVCYLNVTKSQSTYKEDFTENNQTFKFEAAKIASRYQLKINTETPVNAQGGNNDLQKFYYDKVKARLDKEFNGLYASNPVLVARIENFSQKFSQKAVLIINPPVVPPGSSKITRRDTFDKYELIEYQINNKDWYYALLDTTLNGGVAPVSIGKKTAGIFKYEEAAVEASPIVKDSLLYINAFIGRNKEIQLPKISTILIDRQDYVYIKYSDNTTDKLTVSGPRASAIQTRLELNEQKGPSVAPVPGKKAEENKPDMLLEAQLVQCLPKSSFNLAVLTYPSVTDSLILEINTLQDKKRDTIWRKISSIEFKRFITTHEVIKKLGCQDTVIHPSLDVFWGKLEEALKSKKKEEERRESEEKNNKKIEEVRQEFNTRLDKIAAEKDFAALLDLRSDTVLLHPAKYRCGNKQLQINTIEKYLLVDSIAIRISNNIIHQIDIVGTIDGKRAQTSSNHSYGISLRALMERGSLITYPYEGTCYEIFYSDLFLVRPTSDDAISYNLKDGVFYFIPNKGIRQQKLEQKRLLDFVSASVFLDLQAFNANNPNKNLLTELYFTFNINSSRIGWKPLRKVTPGRYTYTNLTLATNLFKESNIIPTYRQPQLYHYDSTKIDTAIVPPFYKYRDSLYSNKYYLKNFDLIKYSFFQIRPVLNVLSIDWKQINTFLDVNLGAIFLGSNARINDPKRGADSISSVPVFSYSGMAEARIRISPRSRYGIDFHLAYVPGLKLLDDTYKSITGPYDVEELVKAGMTKENKKAFYQAELNFYFNPKQELSNTDRGGIYFKMNWFKSVSNSDGHVMFLVGYSSDIKNFFK